MLIKLQLPTTTTATRGHSAKTAQTLSHADKIKADRIVLAVIYLISIIGAIIFA